MPQKDTHTFTCTTAQWEYLRKVASALRRSITSIVIDGAVREAQRLESTTIALQGTGGSLSISPVGNPDPQPIVIDKGQEEIIPAQATPEEINTETNNLLENLRRAAVQKSAFVPEVPPVPPRKRTGLIPLHERRGTAAPGRPSLQEEGATDGASAPLATIPDMNVPLSGPGQQMLPGDGVSVVPEKFATNVPPGQACTQCGEQGYLEKLPDGRTVWSCFKCQGVHW